MSSSLVGSNQTKKHDLHLTNAHCSENMLDEQSCYQTKS